jgi:uncharacterized integral membrane protein (TIGR00697 family)
MTSAAPSTTAGREIHYASRGSSYYDVLLAVFCVVLVVSNIAATKGTQFFSGDVSVGPVQILPVFSDGGAVLFPLAYIIGDVIAEVYGLRAARRAILVGFGTALMAFATFLVVIQLPSASFYENQAAFESVVWSGAQIVGASMVAYVAGQFLNSYVLVRMKARSAEPGLWRRLAGSTGVGEAADTLRHRGHRDRHLQRRRLPELRRRRLLVQVRRRAARHAPDHGRHPRPQAARSHLLGLSWALRFTRLTW